MLRARGLRVGPALGHVVWRLSPIFTPCTHDPRPFGEPADCNVAWVQKFGGGAARQCSLSVLISARWPGRERASPSQAVLESLRPEWSYTDLPRPGLPRRLPPGVPSVTGYRPRTTARKIRGVQQLLY